MNSTGIPLWYILGQVKVNTGESKIVKLLTDDNVRLRNGTPFSHAEPVYSRYLRIYKTLYADVEEVNNKFRRRYSSKGNFFIRSYDGLGFIEVSNDAYRSTFGLAMEKSGLTFEEYKHVVAAGCRTRNEYMQKSSFKKLSNELRTIKILTEEMRGVLHGKARVSGEQSRRTAERTRIDCDVI